MSKPAELAARASWIPPTSVLVPATVSRGRSTQRQPPPSHFQSPSDSRTPSHSQSRSHLGTLSPSRLSSYSLPLPLPFPPSIPIPLTLSLSHRYICTRTLLPHSPVKSVLTHLRMTVRNRKRRRNTIVTMTPLQSLSMHRNSTATIRDPKLQTTTVPPQTLSSLLQVTIVFFFLQKMLSPILPLK